MNGAALDNWITGNYGEDSVQDETEDTPMQNTIITRHITKDGTASETIADFSDPMTTIETILDHAQHASSHDGIITVVYHRITGELYGTFAGGEETELIEGDRIDALDTESAVREFYATRYPNLAARVALADLHPDTQALLRAEYDRGTPWRPINRDN